VHYDYEAEQRRLRNLFWHMGEFKYSDQSYLIDGFLPETGLVILAGDPKVGKTALASAIALAVAKGKPFAGMKAKKGGVLWLCLEESHQERAAVMRKARGLSRAPIYITNERIPIDTDKGICDLQSWALDVDAGLIVIDPLHAAHSGRSLHDGWAARKTLSLLKEFSRTRTILVLHHLAKRGASRVAESVQLAAIATMVVIMNPLGVRELARAFKPSNAQSELARPSRSKTPARLVTLDCMGRGDFANRTWHFISRNSLDYKQIQTGCHGQVDDMAVPAATRLLSILQAKGPLPTKEIAKRLGTSENAARVHIAHLRGLGLARKTHTVGHRAYYTANVE
jgi:hypothetical protein